MNPTRIGIIGCGNISKTYLANLPKFDGLTLTACADVDAARARDAAASCGARALPVDDLLADPDIDLVINLSIPSAHAEVNRRVLEAGKHAYTEKPLATSLEEGRASLDLAARHGLRIGCAPDTFMGAGLQTCRRLIDEGAIGEPVAFHAFMMNRGPERWHPNPGFLYQPGAGPLLDIGPYYLTALVHLLGPIRSVTGLARTSFPERVCDHESVRGQRIPAAIPTHVIAGLELASGPIGTMTISWDVAAHALPPIEIYGSEGSLTAPDPNTFGGPVRLKRLGDSEWQEVPLSHAYPENWRGLGAADMAAAARSGRPHRASGTLALHTLDAMLSILDAARENRRIPLSTSCDRPAPLDPHLAPGRVEP